MGTGLGSEMTIEAGNLHVSRVLTMRKRDWLYRLVPLLVAGQIVASQSPYQNQDAQGQAQQQHQS